MYVSDSFRNILLCFCWSGRRYIDKRKAIKRFRNRDPIKKRSENRQLHTLIRIVSCTFSPCNCWSSQSSIWLEYLRNGRDPCIEPLQVRLTECKKSPSQCGPLLRIETMIEKLRSHSWCDQIRSRREMGELLADQFLLDQIKSTVWGIHPSLWRQAICHRDATEKGSSAVTPTILHHSNDIQNTVHQRSVLSQLHTKDLFCRRAAAVPKSSQALW